MDTQINYCINIEDINSALENNEFKIYYQPQVNTKGEVIGVEALARWFSDKYGNIYPDIFIPILEKYNIICKFQNYILDESCKQMIKLNEITKRNLNLSINISPIQIRDENFMSDIDRIIKSNNFDCRYIEFEITENYSLNRVEKISEKLEFLKDMNINISLDDFGKGYNSIRDLLEFSFDSVKIDKKYTDMVIENPDFIESMIKMIHSVGSKVVSEGVEN